MSNVQIPDYFKYKEREYAFQPYFLRPYFTKYPDRRLDLREAKFRISNHHRLYIAYFGIKRNKLEIIEFQFRIRQSESESRLEKSFPKLQDRQLTWFSGTILLGMGNDSTYYSAYYNSHRLSLDYESYFVLEFKAGELKKELAFKQEEFYNYLSLQFELYKSTPFYKKKREKAISIIAKAYEARGEIWEFNEEDINTGLMKNFLFLNKSILE